MVFFIFWLIFGFLGAWLERRKGGNGVAGFLFGVLLGPLGLVIVLVFAKGRECPFCKENIKGGAKVCPHCQKELPATEKRRTKVRSEIARRINKKFLPQGIGSWLVALSFIALMVFILFSISGSVWRGITEEEGGRQRTGEETVTVGTIREYINKFSVEILPPLATGIESLEKASAKQKVRNYTGALVDAKMAETNFENFKEKFYEVQAPPEMEEFTNLLSIALGKYLRATDFFIEGYANEDVDTFLTGVATMNEGNAYLEKALTEFRRIKTEYGI